MKEATRYLEYLTRHGLNSLALKDYKRCGLLWISYGSHKNEVSIVHQFTDLYKIDYSWIDFVDEVENLLDIEPYHIIWNVSTLGNELTLLYSEHANDNYDKEYLNSMYNEFKTGTTSQAIILYPEYHIWKNEKIQYKVRLGGVFTNII